LFGTERCAGLAPWFEQSLSVDRVDVVAELWRIRASNGFPNANCTWSKFRASPIPTDWAKKWNEARASDLNFPRTAPIKAC